MQWQYSCHIRVLFLYFFHFFHSSLEPVYHAAGINKFLFAGIKWMAVRTNFHMKFFFNRLGLKSVAA